MRENTNQKSPIQTPDYSYYENTTQYEIAQNNALLAITNQDPELYNYWSRLQN